MPPRSQPQQRPAPANDMVVRGVILFLIGATMLIAPYFMGNTPLRQILAQAHIVAWFSLILGAVFLVREGLQRLRNAKQP